MSVERRREVVSNLRYCFNCLARSHSLNSCTSEEACRRCNQQHHTMLHMSTRQLRQQESTVVMRTTPDRTIASRRTPSRTPSRSTHIVRQRQRNQQQPQRRHQQQRSQQQQRRRQQQRSQQYQHQRHTQQLAAQPASMPEPRVDGQLLAEAIKSLANVLCVKYNP